jgi:hypothetical protein
LIGLKQNSKAITQAACVSSAQPDQLFSAVHPSFPPAAMDRIFCRSGVFPVE